MLRTKFVGIHVVRKFGSRTVSSSLELHALPVTRLVGNTSNVIHVDWGCDPAPVDTNWHHHWLDADEVVLSLAIQGPDYWLRVPGIADFLLQMDPCRVLVSPEAKSLDPATLEHQLVDQILPRLLAQKGELLVHASALSIHQSHALFLGPSGWGKSTLAGLLQLNGHSVLSDDCVQLNVSEERLTALPTYPSLRLNADSLDALFPDLTETTPVAGYSEKRRVPVALPEIADSGVPVDALYLLADPADNDGSISITALKPAEICLALIKHSFRLDLSDRAASAKQLERCSHIARTVPAFRLDYPRDYTQQDALVLAITQHLAALPAHP